MMEMMQENKRPTATSEVVEDTVENTGEEATLSDAQ